MYKIVFAVRMPDGKLTDWADYSPVLYSTLDEASTALTQVSQAQQSTSSFYDYEFTVQEAQSQVPLGVGEHPLRCLRSRRVEVMEEKI